MNAFNSRSIVIELMTEAMMRLRDDPEFLTNIDKQTIRRYADVAFTSIEPLVNWPCFEIDIVDSSDDTNQILPLKQSF